MGDLSQLPKAIPQLASIPQCAYPAYGAIIAAGCVPDLKCICPNGQFFGTLHGVLAMGNCSAPEAQTAIIKTREICVEAVPWLAHSRGPVLVGTSTALLLIAMVAVCLRFYARNVARSPYGWDDWLMLFALVWEAGLCVLHDIGVAHGSGKHILMVDLPDITAFSKVFFATTIMFPVAAIALKFSVLFFYHRIFPVRKFTIWCSIVGIVCMAWFVAHMFASFLSCRPLHCFWDQSDPTCKCIDGKKIAYRITSPPDIATNVAILILPMPLLWGLQMKTQRKVALTIIFLLGSFSAVASIVKLPLLVELNVNDISYTAINAGIWLHVEISIGILSGSLLVMRPLLSRALRSQLLSRFSKSRTSGSHRLSDGHPSNPKLSSRFNRHEDGDVYSGAAHKKQKTWFHNVTVGGTIYDEEESGHGSDKEIIPMGKIQVKRDVEWEQEHQRPEIGAAK